MFSGACRPSAGRSVITERDPEYDAAGVWNGMIDRRPLAVVRATGTGHVAAAIRLASEMDLPLAVRGGGHNVARNGTVVAGIVLDLGELRAIDVAASSGTARVGPAQRSRTSTPPRRHTASWCQSASCPAPALRA